MDQDALNKTLIRGIIALAEQNLTVEVNMIALVGLIQTEISLLAGRLEIEGFAEILTDVKSHLAHVESQHETQEALLDDLKNALKRL